ncbi:MAG: hypothetical protein OCC46_16855 [Pseudodesulfovibrio sp.]
MQRFQYELYAELTPGQAFHCTQLVEMLTQDMILHIIVDKYSEHAQSTRNRSLPYLKVMVTVAVNQDLRHEWYSR